jgi:glycosyltransferase involved in cell wall biosynthesis
MKLSVIIPVYNVAGYIEKCVLSLQNQDILPDEFELIIINDGSPDNSREVILKLKSQFSNIVFIDQVNKGVSLARNAGIERATGKYIVFIDPDDYVMENSFSRIWDAAIKNDAQIVFLGYKFLNADNSVRKEILFSEAKGKVYSGIKAYSISRGDGATDPDRSVAILYERDFLNKANIRYIANVPYLEDGEFLARVMCLAERCVFEGYPFYVRTTRPGSATNSGLFFSKKAIDGFFTAVNNLIKFKVSTPLNKAQEHFINQPITKFTLLIVQACTGKGNYSQYKSVKTRLKMDGLDKIDIQGCSGIYYKYGLLYNLSNDLFYCTWSIRLLFISISKRIQSLFKKRDKN